MEFPRHLTRTQLDALERLRAADRRHLKCVFRECPAPSLETMAGEFDGELLHQGGRLGDYLTRICFGTSGKWIGKAFCPINARHGVGYNCFRQGPWLVPKLPMDLSVADSRFESGQSLIISYAARNRGLVRWLVGEVREVVPGVLLGFGLFGPRVGKQDILRRKIPFVLTGPLRDYQYGHPAAPFALHKAA